MSKEAPLLTRKDESEEKTLISNIINLMIAMQVQADLTLKGLELLKREWVKKLDVKP